MLSTGGGTGTIGPFHHRLSGVLGRSRACPVVLVKHVLVNQRILEQMRLVNVTVNNHVQLVVGSRDIVRLP